MLGFSCSDCFVALRSRIAIIPQEPFTFKGTIRSNIDPANEFDSKEIWSVLEAVSLHHVVNTMPERLDTAVSAGQLSVGQTQLLCLARAVIRKPKLVILDEATASLDSETDEKIQSSIRRNFADATVFTIAHRLNTIRDCDVILVLDSGSLVEIGSPSQLERDANSRFAEMLRHSHH